MTETKGYSGGLRRFARQRGLAVLLSSAMVLASCSNYKATIGRPGDGSLEDTEARTQVVAPAGVGIGKDAKIVAPKLKEKERAVEGAPEVKDPWGWVRLRFDVTEAGRITNVRAVDSSNDDVTEAAKELIATWPVEPGTLDGKPAAFRNVEATITFDEYTSGGEVLLKVAAIVVLVPVMLILAIASGGGSLKFGK